MSAETAGLLTLVGLIVLGAVLALCEAAGAAITREGRVSQALYDEERTALENGEDPY